ncbi:hypothetical protein COLU111180_15110 [Cohnella lubricantis]|uniref:Uncharacterized protein n=1 Tax=Cohnella lubricantis TaxID=2163172 RepID=A0A841TF42_9BACL|nr:hypothetical protein [Cohnella lubricantis]MBB6677908.1 hypothetical protein [Cohnella lubricantis]MBP2119091.1 hypothetical protein [Cohnella lubricantis]
MTTNQDNKNNQSTDNNNQTTDNNNNAKLLELIKNLFTHSIQALKSEFGEEAVEGQVSQHEVYGPLFSFLVKNEQGEAYACGFFLRELLANFQQNKNPVLWLSSFYVDLMKTPGGKLLPKPPQSEDEAKAMMDQVVLPMCHQAIKEEFAPEEVYTGLDVNKEHGPVLEAGFPKYKDGNNVCAMPLHLLLAHYLLNRDPSDLIIQGLYRILDEQQNVQPQA